MNKNSSVVQELATQQKMKLPVGLVIISIFISILDDTGAVLYGRVAAPGQFKYQVLLRLKKGTARGTCSGGIIDETHILTAWHCVDGLGRDNIEVVVGAVKYSDDPNEKLHLAKEVRLHRSRSCKPGEERCYDIAVITVSEPIHFNEFVNSILLPEEDYSPGDECVFAGWGVTELNAYKTSDILKYGEGKIVARMFCVGWLFTLKDYEFCFHRVRSSVTTVDKGDSGAPFVCDGVLTGIIIRGSGDPSDPVLVVNVYQLLGFIYRNEDSESCSLGSDE